VFLLHVMEISNFVINLARATLGKILILIWGWLLYGRILIFILGGLRDRRAVQRGILVPTQHLL
jgi:hypothetical protein